MRILISSVGTRGDVQPAVALAIEARKLGLEARLCVPPNFVAWVERLGFEASSIGVEMRPPRPGESSKKIPDLITDQFEVVLAAADGCELIVGAGVHQYAARSIAELKGVPCVQALYAPVTLPSPDHAPPGPPQEAASNDIFWEQHRRSWNERALERVNANRAQLGLSAIQDVLSHILGERPWLAADVILGPALSAGVLQTGAWILAGGGGLTAQLETFLNAGAAPIYLGLGSMPAAPETGRALIEAARAVRRRAILSRGWAGFERIDEAPDCILVDEVDHQALFPRVAAVVHHGGAGTTHTAALAGAPQVVTPMFSDQFYWGGRIRELDIGALARPGADLSVALSQALQPEVATCARALAKRITSDGAAVAASLLAEEFG